MQQGLEIAKGDCYNDGQREQTTLVPGQDPPRQPQCPSPRHVRKKAYLAGSAAVLTLNMGSAFAYSVAIALLDCRSPTSGPCDHCQSAHPTGGRFGGATHRGLRLILVAQLLKLGELLFWGQERGV